MALSEKARVEVYLPDLSRSVYQDFLAALTREFTYTFGGCTVIRGLHGSYLSQDGSQIHDRINVIYADAPYGFEENFQTLSTYADKLKSAAMTTLDEDAILVAVMKTHHAE